MLRLTQFGLVCSIGFSLCGCGGTSSPDVSDSAAPPDRPASADSVQTAGTNEPAEAASPAAPSEADEPRGFDTPEAAFSAMRDAVGEKDWEQAVDCLTDESQDMMAGGLVLVAGLMAAFGGEEMQGVQAVFQKHGVDAAPSGSSPPGSEPGESPEPPEAPVIEDKAAFIADLLTELEQVGEGFDEGPAQWGEAELSDLTIEGERANGTLTLLEDGEEKTEEIEFAQVEGRWLVDFSSDIFTQDGEPGFTLDSASSGAPNDDLQTDLPEEELQEGLDLDLTVSREPPFGLFGDFPEGAVYGKLDLVGEVIDGGFAYGHFTLETVEDDQGNSLELAAPVKDKFDKEFGDRFVELDQFFLDEPSTLSILFVLEKPGDDATALAHVAGSLKIKARTTFVVPDALGKLGEPLTEPEELVEQGQLTLEGPDADEAEHGLAVEFEGPDDVLHEAALLDGAGERIGSGSFNFSTGSRTRIVLQSDEPLPDDLQVRITLAGNERTLFVPLDFEDVPIVDEQ